MGVAFYILFLLIASPVKKEDACGTTKNLGKTSDVAGLKYEYGHEITLKWSIDFPNQHHPRAEKIDTQVSKPNLEHRKEVQCAEPSSDPCSHYKLPVLEPGDYTFEFAFISGSFTIKDPSLKVTHPDHTGNTQYEEGDDVVLEWSMTYSIEEVTGLKIWVWNKQTPKSPFLCDDITSDNKCKLTQVSPGKYKWMIEGVSPSGQTMKSREDGSFLVVEIPVPILKISSFNEVFGHNQLIDVIKWKIKDPRQIIIIGYKVLLWKVPAKEGANPDESYNDAVCADTTNCQYTLPKIKREGHYAWNVEAKSRSQKTRRSSTRGYFEVQANNEEDTENGKDNRREKN